MNGIKMKDCRFYVDKENRTVVCVIPRTDDMLINFMYEHFDFPDLSIYDSVCWGSKFKEQNLEMPMSFRGKAVCAQDDEWDEELGKLIAFSRAKDKCYKSFFRHANMLVQRLDRRLNEMITTFNDFGALLENKQETLQKKIDDKMGLNVDE